MVSSAAGRHGVAGVEDQVEQHLVHLSRVGADPSDVRREAYPEPRDLAQRALQNRLQRGHDVVEVHHLRLQHLPAAVGEQLLGDRRRTPGGLPDMLYIRPDVVVADRAVEKLGGAEDHRHLVVRLVRDAAREPPHRLQAFRLPQPFLRQPAVLPIGHRADPLPDLAVQANHRHRARGEVAVRPVRLRPEPAGAVLPDRPLIPRLEPGGTERLAIVGVDGVHPAVPLLVLRALSGVGLPRRLPAVEPAIGAGSPHDGSGGGHQGPVALFPAGQLRAGSLPLGDIALDGRGAHHLTRGVEDGRDSERDIDAAAVLPDPLGVGEVHPLALADPLEQLPLFGVQLLGDQHEDRLSHHFFLGVAEQPLRGGIPRRHDTVECFRDDGIGGGGGDRGEPGGGALGRFPFGDVLDGADDADGPAGVVARDERALQDVGVTVVGPAEAVLVLPRLGPGLDRRSAYRFGGGEIVGMNPLGPDPVGRRAHLDDLAGLDPEVRVRHAGPDDLAAEEVPIPHQAVGGSRGELEAVQYGPLPSGF